MAKEDKTRQLHRILASCRTAVSRQTLLDRLECSGSTLDRCISELRDQGAHIICRTGQGYYYHPDKCFHLPGLWLDQQEFFGLVAMQRILDQQAPEAVLQQLLEPLEQTLHRRLPDQVRELHRIHLRGIQTRFRELPWFDLIVQAVLKRKRLALCYDARSNGQHSQREVSPHQLIHYRDNWYLDVFCHLRQQPRTLALDRITWAKILPQTASGERIPDHERGYGIFGGRADKTAVLRFTPARARWIADEIWHQRQQRHMLDDGSCELHIPYGNPTELILDICRYGPDVEVLAPTDLRQQVAERLRQAAARYT